MRFLLFVWVFVAGSVTWAKGLPAAQSPKVTPAGKTQDPSRSRPAPAKKLSDARKKAMLERAKKLYQEGRSLFQAKNFSQAIPKFLASSRLVQRLERGEDDASKKKTYTGFRLGFSATLGVAYQWQKQFVKARSHYVVCAKAPAPTRIQKICKKYLPEVLKQLTYVYIGSRPGKATLSYSVDREKTWKTLQTPFRRWMKPGALQIKMSKQGYSTLQRQLALQPGVRMKVLYSLQKPSCPVPRTAPAPLPDQLQMGLTVAAAVPKIPALAALPQPFQPGMPPWQIALIAGASVVGAGIVVGSIGAIAYGVSNRRYVINKNP